MIERIPPPQNIQTSNVQRQKLEEVSNLEMDQVDQEQDFQELCEGAFNPAAVRRNFKSLEQQKQLRKELAKTKEEEKTVRVEEVEKIDELATRYQKQNYELHKKSLLLLREKVLQDDTAEEILKKVLEFYPDKALADEALDFLIETTKGSLREEAIRAKEELNAKFGREVKSGRNIKTEAQAFAKEGLGAPTSLRDFYREVTGKSRDAQTLFNEIFRSFKFEDIKKLIKFLFHALGADLRSKGPSISRPELLKLVDDTKSLQAILGLYKFFLSRMRLIQSEFSKNDLFLPPIIDYEVLSKAFLKLISERYLSPEKVLQLAKLFYLSDELAQIIIFTQMRDATRNTAPKLYTTPKQRQDVLDAIMEALEEIEAKEEEKEVPVKKKKTKEKKKGNNHD